MVERPHTITHDSPPMRPTVRYVGPVALHDMPCAVEPCKSAVLDVGTGVFHPSWAAQGEGWALLRMPHWVSRFLLWSGLATREDP